MAIYHLSVKIIGRSSGRSSVAAAAYRSGDTLTNNYDGLTHDYSRKNWIEHTEILLPPNAPKEYKDRSTLWNAVEMAEKSSNAQLSREVEIALPKDLTLEQQTALIRAYIEQNFVSRGMCADFAIHNPPDTDDKHRPIDSAGNPTHNTEQMIFQNPHAHIMLTMRPLDKQGEWQPKYQKSYLCRKENIEKSIPVPEIKQAESDGWKKQYRYHVGKKKIWLTSESAAKKELKRVDRQPKSENIPNPVISEWNSKDSLFRWRESWASMCNQALRDNNIHEQIDHRSYESQGINKVASVHIGPSAHQAEKRGVQTELGNLNREIADDNYFLNQFKQQIESMEKAQTERLEKLSSRLEGLRAQYIASAYQQIMLSATLASEQDQTQTQLAVAAAMAKGAEQLLKVLETLEQTLAVKQQELETLNPIQMKKRKELESEIISTEKKIKAVMNSLDEIKSAYKPEMSVPVSTSESVEQKRKRMRTLKEIQAQTYKEFYSLVEENKENMAELRALIRIKRNTYDIHTEVKLKEHFADKFEQSILTKAREQAPELPEINSTGIKNTKSHRR